MHHVHCPRCKGVANVLKSGKMGYHKTPEPFRSDCPAGRVTWREAKDGWTRLPLHTYYWLISQGRVEDAKALKAQHVTED